MKALIHVYGAVQGVGYRPFVAELANEYKRTLASAEKAAQIGAIDTVITAGETRQAIVDALDLLEGKRVSNLPKKHSNIPF